ncbi:hypothetical protein MKX01_026816 [Papaver californicum]|nr:hypothetical protein MKX01_026816 [Papaver californicum]
MVTLASRMEIWSLKKRSNKRNCTKKTWCMDFDIDYEGVVGSRGLWFEPILLTKNDEIIFVSEDSALYCYDPKTTTLKMISDNDEALTDYIAAFTAIPHVNTFASLKAIGEKSKRYMTGNTWEDSVD